MLLKLLHIEQSCASLDHCTLLIFWFIDDDVLLWQLSMCCRSYRRWNIMVQVRLMVIAFDHPDLGRASNWQFRLIALAVFKLSVVTIQNAWKLLTCPLQHASSHLLRSVAQLTHMMSSWSWCPLVPGTWESRLSSLHWILHQKDHQGSCPVPK